MPDSPSSLDLSGESWSERPITLTDISSPRTPDIPPKELTARWVAQAIVITFGASMGLILLLGFVLAIWLRWAPDKIKPIFNDAVIPFIEKTGTFSSTVFGPLLAFILGYYFGEKQARTADSGK